MTFKLSRNSYLYRWAFLPELVGGKVVQQTTVCAIFWRTVWMTPGFCCVLAMFSPIFLVCWIIMMIADTIRMANRKLAQLRGLDGRGAVSPRRSVKQWLSETLIYQYALAVKKRVCPLIEIHD